MRKRVVIGLLVAILAAVSLLRSTYLKYSVADLEAKYLATCSDDGRMERLRYKWSRKAGFPFDPRESEARALGRIDKWERALINAGYLEERRFITSNPVLPSKLYVSLYPRRYAKTRVRRALNRDSSILFAGDDCVIARLWTETPNIVVVVAPRENMQEWEEIVRQNDRPRGGIYCVPRRPIN